MATRSLKNIDDIVQKVRNKSRARLLKQCGTIQALDMSKSINLIDFYINVNILETVVGCRQLEIADLLQEDELEQFHRWGLGKVVEERVPGLTAVENYSKLIVLGKPGSGKTTFLKYIAVQCSLGKFQLDKVPIFITLKAFADTENSPDLLKYIIRLIQTCDINSSQIVEILNRGKAIILLDGIDEVRKEDYQRVVEQILVFIHNFFQNRFIFSCRIGDQEYNFSDFKELEIADFDLQQIADFAMNYFASIDALKGKKFIQKLQNNVSIQELANNPLLLTLLCLMFQEAAEFPWNRLELYQEALNLLLKKWDAQKDVERSQIYKKLTIRQKQDLLSQIAFNNFEQNKYFFNRQELEQYIADYMGNLPGASSDLETLKNNSINIIKSIEAQNGLLVERAREIYSFSHLTFQEYLTARQIVICSHPQLLEAALHQLSSRITEKRWREVILLTVGMLRNADYLLQLMKQHIDQLASQDRQLQVLLAWAQQKSNVLKVHYKVGAIRAFYVALARTLFLLSHIEHGYVSQDKIDTALDLAGDTLELAFAVDSSFALNRSEAIDLVIDRALVIALARAINMTIDITLADELASVLDLTIALALSPEFKGMQEQPLGEALLALKQQLPDLQQDRARFEAWWQDCGQTWTEQLRTVTIEQRNIGHHWQFNNQQKETLKQYCYANQLLLDCLNSDCYVTRAVRSQIEDTLLLPVFK